MALLVQLVARRGLGRGRGQRRSRSSAAGGGDTAPRRAAAPPCRGRRSTASTRRARSRSSARRSRSARGPPARRSCARLAERLRAAAARRPLRAGRRPARAAQRRRRRCPGRRPAIVVGAHYDTQARPPGFVGANDGAGGTAAVRRARARPARAKRPAARPRCASCSSTARRRPNGMRRRRLLRDGLRGSRAYARRHAARAAGAGPARLRRQQGPAPAARGQLGPGAVGAAARGGQARRRRRVFPDRRRRATITDDHTPFLRAGIPASRPDRLLLPLRRRPEGHDRQALGREPRRRGRDGVRARQRAARRPRPRRPCRRRRAASTAANASTTVGSNCVPAQRAQLGERLARRHARAR